MQVNRIQLESALQSNWPSVVWHEINEWLMSVECEWDAFDLSGLFRNPLTFGKRVCSSLTPKFWSILSGCGNYRLKYWWSIRHQWIAAHCIDSYNWIIIWLRNSLLRMLEWLIANHLVAVRRNRLGMWHVDTWQVVTRFRSLILTNLYLLWKVTGICIESANYSLPFSFRIHLITIMNKWAIHWLTDTSYSIYLMRMTLVNL